jgi:uncharacterized membrane protein
MAGIGFEIKKLFNNKGVFSAVGGYFFAMFASVGPVLCTTAYMLIIRTIFRDAGLSTYKQSLMLGGLMYAFLGALLISSLINMVLSRYVADSLYTGNEQKIFPSLLGAMALCVTICGLVGFPLMIILDLPPLFELLLYFHLVSMSLAYIVMVYVSAVKDYFKVSLSFLLGTGIGATLALLLIIGFKLDIIYSLLLATVVNFSFTTIMLVYYVNTFFKERDKSYFDFLRYFKKFPSLIFISFFYMLSLFIHNILIWTTDIAMNVEDIFYMAPSYDFPAFIALMMVLPAMVIFVVKTETSFFEDYKEYIKMLSGGGTLKDLDAAAKDMITNMYNKLLQLVQVQLIITCIAIVASRYFFPLIGLGDESITFFGYLAVGYFCIIILHIISTIILYFDDRKSAFSIMATFLVSHILCVAASIYIGEKVYGLGTAVSGIITLAFAFIKLKSVLSDLNYRLYCSQPIDAEIK